MSYTSGFFDATDQGGGNYDRVYQASDFAHYFSQFVGNGVFANPSSGLQVVPLASPSMAIKVLPGNGWINGYYFTVDEAEMLTIPTANPSLSRIDLIVMGLSHTNRAITLYVKSGAVSSSPTPPELLRTSDVYELALASISVDRGVATITASKITDTRQNSSLCGLVTGLIDQIDSTGLFSQFTAAFNTWFDELKGKLSGDPATALQEQVDALGAEKLDKQQPLERANQFLYIASDGTIQPTPRISVDPKNGGVDLETPLSWANGGTSSTSQQEAVSMVFGYGYKDWQSVTTYPTRPGIYRTIGTDIFQHLTLDHGVYGVLLIAKAGYGLHIYADESGRLFWGRSYDTFEEPTDWKKSDGIVEEGTNGIWTWRKYASGIAECWGRQVCTGDTTETWGNLYALTKSSPNYPIAFKELPVVERSLTQNTGNSCWLSSWSAESTTHPGEFALVRPTRAELSAVVSIYVRGKWK